MDISKFVQTLFDGLSNGAIYASLALGLVLVHRATHIPNFAQGELAMLSAFIAWEADKHMPWAAALVLAMVISFGIGFAIERGVVRWVEGASPLTLLIVTLGLLSVINGGAGWRWGYLPKTAESPFSGTIKFGSDTDPIVLSWQTVGIVVVLLIVMTAIFVMFNRTKVGLGLRAAAGNPNSARLVGISVGSMLAIGWGLAALGRRGRRRDGRAAPRPGAQHDGVGHDLRLRRRGAGRVRLAAGRRLRRLHGRAAAGVHIGVLATARQPAQPGDRVRRDHGGAAAEAERPVRTGGGVAGMRRAWTIGIVVSAIALSLTWLVPNVRLYQLATVGTLAIAMLGLNMLTGFNGQISLGHGAFMGIGAYTAAILVREQGMSYPLVVIVAFVLCFAVGCLIGIPALRLPGTSLALITLAFAVAFPQIVKKYGGLTGGVGGINTPPDRQFNSPWSSLDTDQFRYLFVVGVGIILFWIAWNLVRGRWGLAMMATRDNPVSAASMGVSLARTKVTTFGISAGYAGIAGALQCVLFGYISPDQWSLALSVSLLTGIVVGGLGTIAGAVIGGLFVQYLPYYSQEISEAAPTVVYGVIIILVMILAPGGVIGLFRRGNAWLAGKRGAPPSEVDAAEVQASFPTAVDDPVPTATGL